MFSSCMHKLKYLRLELFDILFARMIEEFLSVLFDVNGEEKKVYSVMFLDFLVCLVKKVL